MMTAVRQGDGYVLPVLIGDVQIPPDLLHPHIHYLRADGNTPEQLALQLQAKVNQAKATGQQVREVGAVVQQALELRLPKVVPADFSKYEELQATLSILATSFRPPHLSFARTASSVPSTELTIEYLSASSIMATRSTRSIFTKAAAWVMTS